MGGQKMKAHEMEHGTNKTALHGHSRYCSTTREAAQQTCRNVSQLVVAVTQAWMDRTNQGSGILSRVPSIQENGRLS